MAAIRAKKKQVKNLKEKTEIKNKAEHLATVQADFDNYINSPECDASSTEYHDLLNKLNIAKHRVNARKQTTFIDDVVLPIKL